MKLALYAILEKKQHLNCYECSMTLNTKDTKKTGCRKYAVVLLTMIHETCIICLLYQQSVTNIVLGPRPGSPLFGSIKHPFQGSSFFFVNKHAYQNNPGAIPPPGILLSQRSSIFHLFKLLSPYDPFFSNPYIYDCERLNLFSLL